MPARKIHPLVGDLLQEALRVGAKAAARAFDSVLEDAAGGLAGAEKKVSRARKSLLRKVKESLEGLDGPEEAEVIDDDE
jgi:hypothetical protein